MYVSALIVDFAYVCLSIKTHVRQTKSTKSVANTKFCKKKTDKIHKMYQK